METPTPLTDAIHKAFLANDDQPALDAYLEMADHARRMETVVRMIPLGLHPGDAQGECKCSQCDLRRAAGAALNDDHAEPAHPFDLYAAACDASARSNALYAAGFEADGMTRLAEQFRNHAETSREAARTYRAIVK